MINKSTNKNSKINIIIILLSIVTSLPLIVFYILNSFGIELFVISIVIVVLEVTLASLFYIFFRMSRLLLLIDAVLIIASVILANIFKNDIFILSKPAFFYLYLLAFFLFPLVFSKKYFMSTVKKFNLLNVDVKKDKLKELQLYLFFTIPLAITLIFLIIFCALFLEKSTWLFVSAILPIILYIVAMITIKISSVVSKKMFLNKYKNDEWFSIVNEKGDIIGKAPRTICHNGSKLLHPVVHVNIFNFNKKLLLQKRAKTKIIQPAKWDTSVGGHISFGEELISAVKRETEEEMGIIIDDKKLIPIKNYIFESSIEKEMVFSFVYFFDGKIKTQESEIDDANFFSKEEIERLIIDNVTTENFIMEFSLLKDSKLDLF